MDSTFENNQFKHSFVYDIFEHAPLSFPTHWHHYLEITYVQDDSIIYEVNGSSYHLHPGDILIVWPGELHALQNIPKPAPDKRNLIMLQLDEKLLNERVDFQTMSYLFYQVRILNEENFPEMELLREYICQIHNISQSDMPFPELHSCILIYQFFARIGDYLASSAQTIEKKQTGHQAQVHLQLLKTCKYLSQHCTEQISLAEAAKIAGFSKYHFSKIFREFTGYSFTDFQAKEKLRLAEQLLRNPELSITEVSMEAGFNSISTFNRIFLKFKTVTPSEFRKMYQDQ